MCNQARYGKIGHVISFYFCYNPWVNLFKILENKSVKSNIKHKKLRLPKQVCPNMLPTIIAPVLPLAI